jgi:hypothetical protein
VSCAEWEAIDGFGSPGEFERFQGWIAGQVESGSAERVPVDAGFKDANPMFEEWYRCVDSGQVWRLLFPDPPSRGSFVPVEAGG